MLKLGIIQLSIQEGNIEKNCAHIEELVRKHSSDDIDLLCFPELCISGYNFEKAIISDREALFFSELASKYKIAIMAGINKKEGNQHYDVACIWDETGTLLGEYKKIHLWDKENDFFAKGEELVGKNAIRRCTGWRPLVPSASILCCAKTAGILGNTTTGFWVAGIICGASAFPGRESPLTSSWPWTSRTAGI